MKTLFDVGDAVKGDLLVAEARKVSKPTVIAKTGRHQAQQIRLWENAECFIQRRVRFLPKN